MVEYIDATNTPKRSYLVRRKRKMAKSVIYVNVTDTILAYKQT